MRYVRLSAVLLLAAVLYLLALDGAAKVRERADIVTILPKGQSLDAAQADAMRQEEAALDAPVEVNCWGEAGEIRAESPENGKSAAAALLLVAGQPELVIPGTSVLLWKERGCFLDRETAAELFGTEEAAGQTIRCEGEEYTVCGVCESSEHVLLRCARAADGQALTGISIRVPAGTGAASCAENFMMRHELTGDYIDFTFLGDLCEDLLLLLPLCLYLRLAGLLLPYRRKKGRFLALFLLFLLTAAAACYFRENLKIPSDMIPTRWSDFSFWGTWWEAQKKNLLTIFRTAQGEAQLTMLWNFCRSVTTSVGAAACIVFCRQDKEKIL